MSKSVEPIVHICQRTAWEEALTQGEYRAPSLETEGFIHCSRPEQVLAVANRFYRGLPDLVLLWIDPEQVSAEIHWEAADGEVFPHLYGPLTPQAVYATTDLIANESGSYDHLPFP
jgi:uncharacterized protein (DUF952 family)